jgi:hypothetical protein
MVEVNAKYIKGMINNPDMYPNAAMNQWIAAILMFDFKLLYILGKKFERRLGRRWKGGGRLVEEILMCGVWMTMSLVGKERLWESGEEGTMAATWAMGRKTIPNVEGEEIPKDDDGEWKDEELQLIEKYLKMFEVPKWISESNRVKEVVRKFVRKASRFFVAGDRLWYHEQDGRHLVVVFEQDHKEILTTAHNALGHKGFYATCRRIANRFYWPTLDVNLKWYLDTCHECQIMSTQKVYLPPTVSVPPGLFQKCNINTMHLPTSGGFKYVVQTHDNLSGWLEFAMLRKENQRMWGISF